MLSLVMVITSYNLLKLPLTVDLQQQQIDGSDGIFGSKNWQTASESQMSPGKKSTCLKMFWQTAWQDQVLPPSIPLNIVGWSARGSVFFKGWLVVVEKTMGIFGIPSGIENEHL